MASIKLNPHPRFFSLKKPYLLSFLSLILTACFSSAYRQDRNHQKTKLFKLTNQKENNSYHQMKWHATTGLFIHLGDISVASHMK